MTEDRTIPTLPSPFDGVSEDYQAWKKDRLTVLRTQQESPSTYLALPPSDSVQHLSALEELCRRVKQHGFALYELFDSAKDDGESTRQRVGQLYTSLGLLNSDTGVITGEDHLSLLENSPNESKRRFIPYSNRAMNWHTDGYYNAASSSIKSFCLHCISPAESGGELSLLDNELLLIALYDHNPEMVRLLAQDQAMLLPESKDDLGHERPDRSAAIFTVDSAGDLQTRFTTRKNHIQWHCPDTHKSAEMAAELIDKNTQWQVTVRLNTGQGVITRNILHRRSAFTDGEAGLKRKMLRGRFTQLPNTP